MKKIITVLMVLMVATSMFAETKVLFDNKIEERVGFSDTSYEKMDYEKLTAEEILYIINNIPKEMNLEEYELEYITDDFTKLDKYAKKYNIYHVVDNKQSLFTIFVKVNDEIQVVAYYKLKQTK